MKSRLTLIVFAAGVYAAALPFERTEYTSTMQIGSRPRRTEFTKIYGRIQPYDLYGNYLDEWIDRPLHHNRTWRDSEQGKQQAAARDFRLAKEYEIEGFTLLSNAYDNFYRSTLRRISEAKPENFMLMPGFAWSTALPYKRYLNTVELAKQSPYTPRIDGKIPFFSYGGVPPEKIREIRTKLSADGHTDILLFDNLWLDVFAEYNATGKLKKETLDKIEKQIRETLDTVDGIILFNHYMFRDPKGAYTLSRRFVPELTRDCIAPLLNKIYRDERYRKRLLGVNLRHGYIGHMSGTNEAELGTSQLREALDVALLLNPDIMALVEWNEANENTSFQPTLCNSRVLQRLVRFYARALKGQAPAPLAGDRTALPDMAISARQTLKLGEPYRIELLNIPDRQEEESYHVQMELRDENGKMIQQFAPDLFRRNKLTAITYTIPSEALSRYRTISPHVTIETPSQKFHFDAPHTQLTTSIGWNFKETRMSVRDVAQLEQAPIEVIAEGFMRYRVKTKIRSDEELVSLELLDRGREVWAYDVANTFDPALYYTIRLRFAEQRGAQRKMTIAVSGVDDLRFFPRGRPYASFGRWEQNQSTVQGEFTFWRNGPDMTLCIPRSAKDAVIHIDLEGRTLKIPVQKLVKDEYVAAELPGAITVRSSLIKNLPDHPIPINRKEATIDALIQTEQSDPCLELRAVTRSGKIHRSQPIYARVYGARMETMPVYSATARKSIDIQVPSDAVFTIDYLFDPRRGNLLLNPAAPLWNGALGGGFQYLYPMAFRRLPEKMRSSAPSWKQDSRGAVLDFDGVSNYIVFPPDVLPNGAFTLEFECRTNSQKNQALFRHGSLRQNSLDTFLIDGKLEASFASMGLNFSARHQPLCVGLDFPADRWNRVKITYDLKHLTFTVNENTRRLPFTLRANKAACAIFGGLYGQDQESSEKKIEFFQGQLRSLKIRHNAHGYDNAQ